MARTYVYRRDLYALASARHRLAFRALGLDSKPSCPALPVAFREAAGGLNRPVSALEPSPQSAY